MPIIWGIFTQNATNTWTILFFSSRCLSIVELRPSSSLSTGCVVSLREDWVIFCPASSGWVGRVWSARKKFLETLHNGWELNPLHGDDRQWATFILPLSYHDPGHEEDRQWDSFILPLSYHNWLTDILFISYLNVILYTLFCRLCKRRGC